MKTPKIISISVLALTLAACSNDSEVINTGAPEKGRIVTLTATVNANNASTRTLTDNDDGILTAAWEVGNEFDIVYENTSNIETHSVARVTNIDADGNATVTAELEDPKSNQMVRIHYPKHAKDVKREQDGTLQQINKYFNYMSSHSQLVTNGDKAQLAGGVQMHYDNCIMKMTFSDGTNDFTKDVTRLELVFERDVETLTYYVNNIFELNPIYVALNHYHGPWTVTIKAYTSNEAFGMTKSDILLPSGKLFTIMPLEMQPLSEPVNNDPFILAPDIYQNGGNPFE